MIKGVFIFRRDFRTSDNPALFKLSKKCDIIYPIFILDPNQIESIYFSPTSFSFMINSLISFNKEYLDNKLHVFEGDIILNLKKIKELDYIGFNLDFSEYSLIRDKLIIDYCNNNKINVITDGNEMFLNESSLYLKDDGAAYVVFSSYYRNSMQFNIRKPYSSVTKFKSIEGKSIDLKKIKVTDIIFDCSRLAVNNSLKEIKKLDYEENRRRIDIDNTMLSPYLKYGIISGAELGLYLKKNKLFDILRQLHFRNFYFLIRKYNSFGFGHIDKHYEKLKWKNNLKEYKKMWIDCNTGFPIIDACVRKLNKTGWINNRSLLLIAFFSVKLLHIDPFHPQIGGQVATSKKLIFCCYANNYCNWHFILSIFDWGSMRFSPKSPKAGRKFDVNNIKKLDPELKIIREYIPELSTVSDKDVFDWYNKSINYKNIYFQPMINVITRWKEYEILNNRIDNK